MSTVDTRCSGSAGKARRRYPSRRATLTRGIAVAAALSLALCVLLARAGATLYSDPGPWTGPMLALGVPLVVVLLLLCLQPQACVEQLSFAVRTTS